MNVAVRFTESHVLDRAAVSRLLPELSSDEALAAAAFAFDEDRRTYIAAHVLLRRGLREMLAGEEPRLMREPHGRPVLEPGQRGRPALSFSLTHTRGFAACALLRGAPVGIDAEDVRRPVDLDAVARRWFAPSECRLLEELPRERRADAFFRIWTAKEAILKATGLGLRISPELFAVEPGAGRTVIPKELGIPTLWRLAELVPVPHIRLAVAVPGRGRIAPTLTRVDLE